MMTGMSEDEYRFYHYQPVDCAIIYCDTSDDEEDNAFQQPTSSTRSPEGEQLAADLSLRSSGGGGGDGYGVGSMKGTNRSSPITPFSTVQKKKREEQLSNYLAILFFCCDTEEEEG